MTYEERLKIVKDVIDNANWRSGESEVGYGEDGEYEYYPCLWDNEIDPVAKEILDKLGLGE